MDKIEKIMLIVVIILTITISCLIHNSFKKIENKGGIRAVIIETGKEIKGMVKEINE